MKERPMIAGLLLLPVLLLRLSSTTIRRWSPSCLNIRPCGGH